jgi:rhamnosyltransferase
MNARIKPSATNTCAVIVTYFPDDGIISRLKRIQDQLPMMIIVDNASSKHCMLALENFASSNTVTLLRNDKNEGIGKALNQAASYAEDRGFLWIVTFDQDTIANADLFETLATIYTSSDYQVPLIGSNYWNTSKNKQFLECRPQTNKDYLERRTIITSGTLLRLNLIESIGNFREDYFIDSIDHEYCLRARAHGFKVIISCKTLMSHAIGSEGSHWMHLLAFDHPPIRKYYMFRNTLVTIKTYFWREPRWVVRQLLRLLVEFLSISFFERDKLNKGYALCRGTIDAARNKMGSVVCQESTKNTETEQ